jgi:hypothetical protein
MTKRNVWMLLVAIFVAPAVAALVFLVLVGLTDSTTPEGNARAAAFTADYWPLVLMFSYVIGFIPGVVSTTILILVTRFLPALWHRLVAGPAIAALVCAIAVGLFLFSDSIASVDDWAIVGVFALTGAAAALFTVALIELFHPLPKPGAASP